MNEATPPPPSFPPAKTESTEATAPTESPTPPTKARSNGIVIGSAAAVIAAVIGTGIFVVQSNGDDDKPATTTTSTPAEGAAEAAGNEEEPEPSYTDLDADSFSIKLRTTDRQCFGSAGCNVTVEPKLTLLADERTIDPDAVYEITYEIRGDESGPVIATAELSEQTSLNYTPTSISGASSGTKVSVKIIDVMLQG